MKIFVFFYFLIKVLYSVQAELYQFQGYVTYPPGVFIFQYPIQSYQYREPENSNWKLDKYEVKRIRDGKEYFVNQTAATWISKDLLNSENLPKQIDDYRNISRLQISDVVPQKFPRNIFYHFDELTQLDIWRTDIESLAEDDFENANQLQILFFIRNKIKTLQPNVFRHLVNVKKIDLFGNEIETLNAGVFDSNSLKEIRLTKNKLRFIKPEWFESSKLINLEIVELGQNFIEEIDFSIFFLPNRFLNLKHLSLEENKLKVVKNCIKKEPSKLELFQISDNPSIDTEDANAIYVNARDVKIKNINATQCRIGPNVQEFYAQNNKINNVIVEASAEVAAPNNDLTNIGGLKILDLTHNFIQTFDIQTLSKLNDLRTLDLSENQIKSVDFGSTDSLQKLKSLILSRNIISDFRLNRVLPELKSILLDNNALTNIDLSLKTKAPKLKVLILGTNNWSCDTLNVTVTKFVQDGIYLCGLCDPDVTSPRLDRIDKNSSVDELVKSIGCKPRLPNIEV